MSIGNDIKADEIREIFREVLEDFRYELIEELKEELLESSDETQSNASLVRTSEVCKRWGRSRTTLSKLIREKKLKLLGGMGILTLLGLRMLWRCLVSRFANLV